MRWMRIARYASAALSVLGLLLPGTGAADEVPASHRAGAAVAGRDGTIRDVALQGQGELQGHVVDAQGRPLRDTLVTAVRNGNALAVAKTDGHGRFVFPKLRAGLYHITTGPSGAVYRVWTAGAAPPAATRGVLIVDQPAVVRGNLDPGQNVGAWLTSPLTLGVLVAAIIAYPLATDSDDAS